MNKYITLPTLLLGIVAIISLFLAWPAFQQYLALRAAIQDTHEATFKKTAFFTDLRKTAVEMDRYQSEVQKLDLAFPNAMELPVLYHSMEELVQQSGLFL